MKVFYTAAHGGFRHEAVPLGGGAAVFEHLMEEWGRTRPFEVQAITPAILGGTAPSGKDLVGFSEHDYAAFSRQFERASTEEILKHDPADTAVLVNDVSEGPDFETLAMRGFRIFTIYHVDVVAYVSAIYLRGFISPETTVRWYRRVGKLLPRITQLVWKKQEASVGASTGLIVPSQGMRDTLLRCYPECPAGKIHVLPWGSWSPVRSEYASARKQIRDEYGISKEAHVLMTLSRVSPEKGQDQLLDSLLAEEQTYPPSAERWLFICGDAAFMQGRRYLAKLRERAAKLRHTRVVFPGYVTGDRKSAFFQAADVFVFPSRHESYGLTLIEALAAGLPAVCCDHLGAREILRDEFGVLVQPRDLARAIQELLDDPFRRARMSIAARTFASEHRFEDCAAQIAKLLEGGL